MSDSSSSRTQQQSDSLPPSSKKASPIQQETMGEDELSDSDIDEGACESYSVGKSESLPLSAGTERDRGKGSCSDNRPSKRKKTAKFKKHPDAPKRFRSAFIIFSKQRHQELRTKLEEEGEEMDTMNIAGRISNEWRTLDGDSKVKWEDMAREDKERYQREKAAYSGPWKVRTNLRKPKDPNSPKKPVPAYFAFSNERRQEVKNKNPNATNGEISRLLSKMWNEAPDEIRRKYLEQEAKERGIYTEKMKEWRAQRREREKDTVKEPTSKGRGQAARRTDIVATSYLGETPLSGADAPAPFPGASLGDIVASGAATLIRGSEQTSSGSSSLDAIRMLREGSSATSSLHNASQSGFIQQNRLLPAAENDSTGFLSQLLRANAASATGSGDLTNRLLTAALQRQMSPPSQSHLSILRGGQLPGINPALMQQVAETTSSRTASAGLMDMLNSANQRQQQQFLGNSHPLISAPTGTNNSNMELLLISRLLQSPQQSSSIAQTPFPPSLRASSGGDNSQQGMMLQSFLRYLASGADGGSYAKPTGS